MKLDKEVLSVQCINQKLLNIEYAVRGAIVQRALQIERELAKGVEKPFERVVRANIGDCHALGQNPITFLRQLLAVTAYPALLTSPDIPEDVKERAREILDDCKRGSVGSYSPSRGLQCVRSRAVQYLTARDGPAVRACVDDIVLGSGASDLVRSVLQLINQDVDGQAPAVLVPSPQYPLFSGTLAELGMRRAEYFLDEDHGWEIRVEELERALGEARAGGQVRALVVINPGNPTGQVLAKENIEAVIKFAYENHLLILADEVYQENIVSKPFHSFKKVMHSMGAPYSHLALASFMTVSKGWAAECGLRGAMLELLPGGTTGVARGGGSAPGDVGRALDAARALQQCSGVLGQVALYAVLNPPRAGEPSYAQFSAELHTIRRTLAARTHAAYRTFNSIPGYSCNVIDGAMFAYPCVSLPARAQLAARAHAVEPDHFYCMALLEDTGICVVPGSGFGQVPGTFHFRTTILHEELEFDYIMESIRRFHLKFMQMYQ